MAADIDWVAAFKRADAGESTRSLAKHFGVPEPTMRRKINAYKKEGSKLSDIIAAIVKTETPVRELMGVPVTTGETLSQKLQILSMHLAQAAMNGSFVANRLSVIAAKLSEKLEDAPNPDDLRLIGTIMQVANESSKTALALLTATKGAQMSENSNETRIIVVNSPDG